MVLCYIIEEAIEAASQRHRDRIEPRQIVEGDPGNRSLLA